MSKQNKTLAFQALDTFATARVQLIEGMIAAGYKTAEDARPIVIEWACAKTGAAFNVSKAGKVMLDSKHAKYEAAKTVVRDVMLNLQGTTRRESSPKKEPVEVPAHVLKLAKALAEAAGDRSLANTALALAFAK